MKGCWESNDFEDDDVKSSGWSGRLISIWNTNFFQKSKVIKCRHFLIVIGKWKEIGGNTIFANIYGPQSMTDKQTLWDDLLNIQ